MPWRLDRPSTARPHRIYAALTNRCNRQCPWCSTCSSTSGSSYLSLDALVRSLPAEGAFQVQLDGGEPTLHPRFWAFVRSLRAHPRCRRLLVATNGTTLPRDPAALRIWIQRLGTPVTLKVSVNHHLIERDPEHVSRVRCLREVMDELGGDRLLVVNARIRNGVASDEVLVVGALRRAGLEDHANVFPLQRYGMAAERMDWPLPRPATLDFTLVNPDGHVFGSNLIERSEAMRALP